MRTLVVLLICLAARGVTAGGEKWYAGQWDSRFQMSWNHPYAVGVRVEVRDGDTDYPIKGAEVSLEGTWSDYAEPEADLRGLNMGRWDYQGSGSMKREFTLIAVTDENGICVFGLTWHDKFNARDDLAKIERINIRHPDYRKEVRDLPLHRLIQGREAWRELAGQHSGSRLFLIIANGFKGFDKEATTDALFFAMVRDESYSYVYPDGDWGPRFPRDYIVSLPQKEAGPYLVIPITQVLMRAVPQVRVRSDRRSRPHHKEDGQP